MVASVWILGDQLLYNHPALVLAEEQVSREQLIVLIIENESRAQRLPYQRKKLVLIFSAMRHFADRLRSLGYQVDYRVSANVNTAIKEHIQIHQPETFYTMAASEFRGRSYQQNLPHRFNVPVNILPNTQFLTGRFDPIPDPHSEKRVRQEQFYRKMRQHFDLLIEADGEPVGGRWNFDKSNRQRLPKDAKPPPPISFKPDKTTIAVMDEVDQKYHGLGETSGFDLAVTHEQANLAAKDFFDNRLPDFGAYEDAMSSFYGTIYHSRLSPYLNLGLLDPLTLAQEVQNLFATGHAPINSVEGFMRQVIGWREYIYWQYWRLMPELHKSNYWHANRQLPSMFWDGDTQINCLHHTISRALDEGYTHHIERLMILSNFCLLTGIEPMAVNDWFLSAYIDSYEWVMLPNVIGMGLYADGGMIATKPYIASANYINKMSDYCGNCFFDLSLRIGERACPYNYLYWNFILEHEESLRSNPRMARNLLGLKHLDNEQRSQVKENAHQFLDNMK